MIDRRKKSREFLTSGWDPYVVELTAQSRGDSRQSTGNTDPSPPTFADPRLPVHEPVLTRRRAMLARRMGGD